MKKTYVLDTNIIFDDAKVLEKLEGKVILPFQVLEEIDKHKSDKGQVGANARYFNRTIDSLMKKGNLFTGVKVGKVTLQVHGVQSKVNAKLTKHKLIDMPDNRILATALCYKDSVLLSNDIGLRLKASALAQKSVGFGANTNANSLKEIYSGVSQISVLDAEIDQLYATGRIESEVKIGKPNEFFMLTSATKSAMAMKRGNHLVRVSGSNNAFGIRPKNAEQTFALEALMDPAVTLVTLLGKAGTGKSLLCLAAALDLVLQQKLYKKIIIVKAPVAMEHDIGFLPGSLEEKMAEFSDSIYDSFDVIMGENKKINIDMLLDSGVIEIVPQTYMRGRSLKDTIVCVEEAQNLSPHSIKTLCTRLSDNSRIFMTGDLQQIDNGKLDWHSSGLRHVIEAFADQPSAAHITLQKGERSSFADIASEIL